MIEGFRLSPQQRHVWSLQQAGHLPSYRVGCAVRVDGPFELKVFEAALRDVVERHEIFRTTFTPSPVSSVSVQVVSEGKVPAIEINDLREQNLRDAEEFLPEFDDSSPIRISLNVLAADKHVLHISLSALCADAATLTILVRELSLSYSARLRGEVRAAGPLQYADVAEWKNELLESEVSASGKNYWRKQNSCSVPRLALPFERVGSPAASFEPRAVVLDIKSTLAAALDVAVRDLDTSTSTFLLACWQTLVWRLGGQSRFVVGMTCDGRTYDELRENPGPLSQSVPLQCHLEGRLQFRQLVKQVAESSREADEWQEYFDWDSFAESEPSYFSLGFEFDDQPEQYGAGDVTFTIQGKSAATERFNLRLSCARSEELLRAQLDYDSGVYHEEDVERVAEEFLTLLESAIADPQASIDELEVVGSTERHRLLCQFNAPVTAPSSTKCLHQLFEEQVERTPDNVAVVFGDLSLTHAQLNARANQLAHYLRARGIGPEVTVAICMERCVEMVVGLIGILKAGGAYVPLDPAYPGERQAFMLDDSRAAVVLTQRHLAERDQLAATVQVICLDSDSEAIARESDRNPSPVTHDRNAAYVIYTSGSTGQPKGVVVEHRGLVNAIAWLNDTLELSGDDRCLLKTPITFDAAGRELFPILMAGGRLVIAEPEGHRDCRYIAETMRSENISLLHCVPSFLRLLVEEPAFEAALTLRAVMCGGEALPPEVVARFHHRSKAKLYNVYGPTETIIDSAFGLCESEAVESTTSIGRPIPNAIIYIADDRLRLVPIGVTGNLYIGGVGLARGYLNRAELTAEKFIPDPFSVTPGERLYKTGDLARYLADGRIEFLGRADHQVKIRGFRIELGEVETVLGQHPGVSQSAVVAEELATGEKRIIAYVVGEAGVPVPAGELRAFLKARLPEHMVPAAFVALDAIPLTPNGKVDRRALLALERTNQEPEHRFVAPRTPAEELVARVWSHVLGVERIGIHDNFFDLGGHSLLATQAISRLREAFAVEMPLRRLFEMPTVASLAESIEATGRAGNNLVAPPIVRVPRGADLPLSFAQQRLWFIDQLEPGSSVYNFPAAVRLKGPLNVEVLERSINEIVKRHEVMRTTFTTVEGRPVQVIAQALTITMPVLSLEALPEDERETRVVQLAIEEARRPFDLARGPLLRASLIRLSEEEHVGLLTMHHIVSDGWSTGILIREIAFFYESLSSGRAAALPELPVQYADFAHWQRNWLQGEVLETQLNYWKQQLLGAQLLELPADRPRPSVQTLGGAHQSMLLAKELTEGIRALSRDEGTTLFMTLLAAFKILLHRYTGQDDVVIGTPIANRNRLEIEGLIGFFVNTLVMRTDLSGDPSCREMLRRVREVCLGAYAHQDLPFERLVEELHLQRNLGRNPLFQVMLVLRNEAIQTVGLSGLTLSPLEVDSGAAHFDLTLHVAETEQGLVATLAYNKDLFDEATIARMLGHFRILLEALVASPESRISELPILSETETWQLLVEWNDSKVVYDDLCVHQLFEMQVERTPDALAVVCGHDELTYAELNRRANKLAHHLQALGVGPEIPVAICLEPSATMIVALMGILKAGGVYLPLDPAYPKVRLSFMLDSARVAVILTHEGMLTALPECESKIICLDLDSETIAQRSDNNPIASSEPESAAYILFTSGSTGQPKGVVVSHNSIAVHCRDTQKCYDLQPSDRVLQFASLSFDLSLEQILPTLVIGARLVMMGPEVWHAAEFHRKISELGLTVLSLSSGYWNEVAREWADSPELASGVQPRLFIVGGDVMLPSVLELWRQTSANSIRLVNAYGPTEATVTATAFEVQPDAREGAGFQRISIGRALASRQTYILDRNCRLVPVGIPGELHIGGVSLARGYLNRPELTAEKFIPSPFSAEPGARLYKTGDVARYLPDGNIEFLGRLDGQVKIRGFRIELGEVEVALGQHPAVRETVVVAQDDSVGEKRLVAYVVAEGNALPATSAMRSFLMEKLPEYMVPSAYVMLDALPLMLNGKVDRSALPAADSAGIESKKAMIAPRDALELQLVQLWEEVLGVGSIGVRDNFFELGGHSLAAVRLFALIENRIGRRLPLATVFRGATIEELATLIRDEVRPEYRSCLVPIQPYGNKRPLFLIHPAGGQVFPYVQLGQCLGADQPCYALQAKGLEEGQVPHTTIEAMASYYIEAVKSVQPEGPYSLAGWSMGGTIAFEMARQLWAQGERVALPALLDSRTSSSSERVEDGDLEATLLLDVIRYFGLSLDFEELSLLPKDEVLARVLEQAKKAGLVPQELEVSHAHRFVEQCKADFRAARNYVPRRYAGRIVLFKAAENLGREPLDPALGWSEWADGGVEVCSVPGNHANMVYSPNVEVLAEKLKSALREMHSMDVDSRSASIRASA
jgi:amino acid adenylation domain-containing protein